MREAMEFSALAEILRRWWWLVVIPTLLAGLAALPALRAADAANGGYGTLLHYSAVQAADGQQPASGMEDLWLASELAVHALSAWTRTDSFRRELGAAPGMMPGDVDALAIAADNHRSIGQLFLNHPDAPALTRSADAAIHVLQMRNHAYLPQLGEGATTVSVLDRPNIVPAPPPLSARLAPLLRVALGVGAGLVLVLLAHTFDPALRQRREVEALGLTVLATLPRDRRRQAGGRRR